MAAIFDAKLVAQSLLKAYGDGAVLEAGKRAAAARGQGDPDAEAGWTEVARLVDQLDRTLPRLPD